MIELVPNSRLTIDAANPVNWSHSSMQPNVRPVAWYLALPGLMGGAKWRDLMSPADLSIGNHGTLTNIAQSGSSGWQSTNRLGGFGELRLDGVNDYVNVAYSPSLDITTAITLIANIRFTTIASDGYIISKGTDRYDILTYAGDPGKVSFYLTLSSGGTELRSPLAYNDGLPHRVVGTYDSAGASGNMRLYVDGSLVAQSTKTGTITTENAPLRFGSYGVSSAYFWAGSILDVAIYNRALSAPEIIANYLESLHGHPGVLNRINTTIAPPTGSGLLLQRRRAA